MISNIRNHYIFHSEGVTYDVKEERRRTSENYKSNYVFT